MAAAVFRAKFTVPSLPADFKPRSRLDRLWRAWSQRRLLTVTAGAGWGKTCFLADHAGKLGDRALWYTLDDLDRDPSVLVAHLAVACGMPQSAAPALEQLAGIIGRLDRCRLLVLDDVQAIAHADRSRMVLERLLRYLPPSCRLVISAREPIALAGARLRARGEAAALTSTELAFTGSETAAFLSRRLGRAGSAALAARVHDLTEGWPTGLEIVCQALGECHPRDHDAVLQRLVDGGGRWFEFFSEEVLAELDDATRRFLLLTSVLPHLEPEHCDRLTGRRDSAAVLADLAARRLFTLPVGERSWRYHPLLRACLRGRLDRELPAGEVQRLRRRAAALLSAAGETEAAVCDLARVGDSDGARALVARHARALTGSQRPETLALALASLPEAQVRRDPAVLLVRASLAQMQGRWEHAGRDLRTALRDGPPGPLAGMLHAHHVRLTLQHGRFAACLQAGRRALAAEPRPATRDRGIILAAMGVAAASLGRMAEGRRLLLDALTTARRCRDLDLQGRCLFLLAANVHYIHGNLVQALRDARQARDIFAGLGRGDLACHAEGVLGFVLAGMGESTQSRQSSLWALQKAEAIGYRQIAGYARLTLGECELLAGDPVAAADRFGEAGEIARELGEDALANWARLGQAEAYWRVDDHARAAAATESAHELAARRRDHFCLARALAQRGRLAARQNGRVAQQHWSQAERILTKLDARLELARLRLWRAAAAAEDPAAVLREVAASPHAFLIERCEASLAAALRAGLAAGESAGRIRRTAPPRAREPLHLRLLGTLEIDRGAEPLVAGPWRSRRARRLLNVLAGHRLRPVPRDRVLETLWPEADPELSLGNLRQAVFQLRRVLEPSRAGEPVHVKSEGETLRLDLGPGGTCDLVRFETLLDKARAARQAGRLLAERAHLHDALTLWRGPYLADAPYDPGVEEQAAAVRQRFLRAAERLLELLAVRGAWEDVVELARRALAEDPVHEAFARHLLLGLLRLGHRQEVRRAYAAFEARLVRDLDLLPSARLKDLAEQAYAPVAE